MDPLRSLKSIGRDLTGANSFEFPLKDLPERVCLAIASPQSKLDNSAYSDAFKAAKMYIRADFAFYFLPSPDYPKFCDWLEFLLTNVKDHLSLIFTGYTMKPIDGIQTETQPCLINGREILPKRIFSLIRKHKNPNSRLTIIVNGCPAVETWSNIDDIKTQTISFSLTSATPDMLQVLPFKGTLPEKVLLMTVCPRLDTDKVQDRGPGNYSNFIRDVSKMTKKDPILSAQDLLARLQPQIRKDGQQLIVYSSSPDVNDVPFLL